MAFTTWTALRTAIKNAIASHVAGTSCVGEYSIGDRRMKYRSFDELLDLYKKTYELESIETMETNSTGIFNKVKFTRPV